MTRLSDTQLVVLTAACQHPERQILPFPEHLNLRGGSVTKVVDSLLAKGLIAEVPWQPGQKLWRDGHQTTLVATDAAFTALGITVETADSGTPQAAQEAANAEATVELEQEVAAAEASFTEPYPRRTRADTKQAKMITMLRDPAGATVDDIVAATGWQKHTVRGALAGALKKKLGLTITSEKVDGRGRVYRVEG